MAIILFLLCSIFLIDASANDGFTQKEREKAGLFIYTCFDALESYHRKEIKRLERRVNRRRKVAEKILASAPVDQNAYENLDAQINDFAFKIARLDSYARSLARPKEKITDWEREREAQARLIATSIFNTEEWQYYTQNPSDVEIYALLHKRIADMVELIIPEKDRCAFVLGTHAYSSESDKDVNYAFDRAFMLTLYLLSKELQSIKGSNSPSI